VTDKAKRAGRCRIVSATPQSRLHVRLTKRPKQTRLAILAPFVDTSVRHAAAPGLGDTNQRLVGLDEHGVTFRWKDYRVNGRTRNKTMTLEANEFVRRFLLHVLPVGFHRFRHEALQIDDRTLDLFAEKVGKILDQREKKRKKV
jgi:hypothetical protein